MLLIIIFSYDSAALFKFLVSSTRDKHWKFCAGWNHFGSIWVLYHLRSFQTKYQNMSIRSQLFKFDSCVSRPLAVHFTKVFPLLNKLEVNSVLSSSWLLTKYWPHNCAYNTTVLLSCKILLRSDHSLNYKHDDIIKWKHFPRYWPFVWGIHRSPVNSPYKGKWRGALMFSLICVWINGWVNNGEAGDLKRYHTHYDVTVMGSKFYN